MICPICGNEMAIAASRTCVDRDDRPDLATRVWVEQDLCCRNRSCSGWGRVKRRARTFLIGEAEAGEEEHSLQTDAAQKTEPAAEQNEEG